MQRRDGAAQRTSGERNGPEIVGSVVQDRADERQSRPRFDGELDPDDPFGELGTSVVAWLVLRDQAQLADLRLQGGRADDALDGLGNTDHLAHPRACLARGEVATYAGAEVTGRADVQHCTASVPEEIHAGCVGQRLGEVALPALGGCHLRGERLQLLDRVHAEVAQALHEAVEDVDGRSRVGERAVVRRGARMEQPGKRRQLAVRRVVSGHHPPGQLGGVEHLEARARRRRSAR